MCLIVLAWHAHPRYALVVAANRDEFHRRPAEAAGWWPDQPAILAGRDLQAGGTWLAIAKSGRFATVTNYRENRQPTGGLRSRGELVSGFVTARAPPAAFAASLSGSRFAGFSLLLATSDELAYVSNRDQPARLLPPGIYGLSNSALDTPWPKLLRTRERLRRLLQEDAVDDEALLHLLDDRTRPTGAETADSALPYELPAILSSPFIVSQEYGTRCSTALMHAHDGSITFSERRFDRDGAVSGHSRFEFQLSLAHRPR